MIKDDLRTSACSVKSAAELCISVHQLHRNSFVQLYSVLGPAYLTELTELPAQPAEEQQKIFLIGSFPNMQVLWEGSAADI